MLQLILHLYIFLAWTGPWSSHSGTGGAFFAFLWIVTIALGLICAFIAPSIVTVFISLLVRIGFGKNAGRAALNVVDAIDLFLNGITFMLPILGVAAVALFGYFMGIGDVLCRDYPMICPKEGYLFSDTSIPWYAYIAPIYLAWTYYSMLDRFAITDRIKENRPKAKVGGLVGVVAIIVVIVVLVTRGNCNKIEDVVNKVSNIIENVNDAEGTGSEDAEQLLATSAKYFRGDVVKKDARKSFEYCRKAAELGNDMAQCNLGFLYEKGEGVERDWDEALKWYRKAADNGNMTAKKVLKEREALMGLGRQSSRRKDKKEPVDLVRKTAKQGDASAQDISIEDLSLTMKWCPPGKFVMGRLETEDGRFPDEPQHSVTIHKGFWIGETEVTQGQWKLLMGETIVDLAGRTAKYRQKKEDVKNLYDEPNDGVPVYNVCWNDATEFCRKLAAKEKAAGRIPEGYEYRLPSEEEWEYACRAGSKTALPNNKDIHIIGEYNAPELDDIAWYGGNSSVGFSGRGWDVTYITGTQHPGQRAAPRAVKGKKPNAWGLYDMLGNVSEWCLDRMEKGRAMRGGSWSNKARLCRPARRAWNAPDWRANYIGFRVVLAPIVEKSSTATGEVESIDRKAAEEGNVHAQNSLGFSYLKGNGVEKNAAEAVKWFRKAADQGHAKSQYQLGLCYARGDGVAKDMDEALKWYCKAAEQGHGEACYEVGEVYRRGLGRKKDANKAVECYRKGAAVGDSRCITSLGFRYFYGDSDLTPKDHKKAMELFQKSIEIDRRPWAYDGAGLVYYYGAAGGPNYEKAVEMFRKASSMGVYEADYYLGICYENGRGVAKDQVEAVKWYEKAAERGHGVSCYFVGEAYRKGVGKKKDANKAVEWYRKGAATGYSGCIMTLGFRYYYGDSDLTPKDHKKAMELFQKSIDIDRRPWACYGAGLVYYYGETGNPDYEKAVEMFRKASSSEVYEADYYLGICYENGQGVAKDQVEAVKWYRKAGEKGVAAAQYRLGMCYARGAGVAQDKAEAVRLLRKAAEKGHAAAKEALKKLE